MKNKAFDRIYKDVPQAQKEGLLQFRSAHPPKHLFVDGFDWECIAGRGCIHSTTPGTCRPSRTRPNISRCSKTF